MGLINELICKHTYQGRKLPSNIIFIAACNPYRLNKKKTNERIALNSNQADKKKNYLELKKVAHISLIYNVHPLPFSLLNYVLNFGYLTYEDEKRYIKQMTLEPIEKTFGHNNANKIEFTDIHNLASTMVLVAHNFLKERNYISSVSLREIASFNIFYEFFFIYLKEKKAVNFDLYEKKRINYEECNFYNKLDNYNLQIHSIILAIFVCYYLRIKDNKTRIEFEKKMSEILL